MKHLLPTLLLCSFSIVAYSSETDSGDKKRPTFSRPEDRGVQFTKFSTPEIVKKISISTDRVEQRKLARELGNRSIAGKLKLDQSQQEQINAYVKKLFQMSVDADGNTRGEARCQLARLWYAAVPACLNAIKDVKNVKKKELAAKSLILMRNREIITAVIKRGKQIKDGKERFWFHWVLSRMNRQRTTVVPNRTCIDSKTSKKLYDEMVVPALAELKKKGITDPWD